MRTRIQLGWSDKHLGNPVRGRYGRHLGGYRFQPSSLSRSQQMAEIQWFIGRPTTQATGHYTGAWHPRSSTRMPTEAKTLARAFEEITGIAVRHETMPEGDLVDKIYQPSKWQFSRTMAGYRLRPDWHTLPLRLCRSPDRFSCKAWARIHEPRNRPAGLHRNRIHHRTRRQSCTNCPTSSLPTLVWFRADWFDRADLKERFRTQVRLRTGCAAELVGLRRYCRLLHQRCERARWP